MVAYNIICFIFPIWILTLILLKMTLPNLIILEYKIENSLIYMLKNKIWRKRILYNIIKILININKEKLTNYNFKERKIKVKWISN